MEQQMIHPQGQEHARNQRREDEQTEARPHPGFRGHAPAIRPDVVPLSPMSQNISTLP